MRKLAIRHKQRKKRQDGQYCPLNRSHVSSWALAGPMISPLKTAIDFDGFMTFNLEYFVMNNINSSFSKLSSSGFLAQAQRIVTALTANPAFPEPWPASVPSLAQLNTDLAAYEAALGAAAAGDRNRIIDRKAARQVLQTDLALVAPYLQAACKADPTVLGTTGYPLRKHTVRSTVFEPPAAPANFTIARGPVSGTLSVSCSRMSGVGSYEAQIATGDPTVETNWSSAGLFKNSQRMTLQGLTPGKSCSVRLRAIGTAGPGAWTLPASLIVV